ncbi:MAG TPA: hypothetical protein DCS33_08755 [Gammaproteobacteria bacterium]|jgi:hypothetical protein|nr:hypothetical protein [Gammaproteobacteria bacterium]
MNSLAVTDSLLLLVTIVVFSGSKNSPSLRISVAIFGAAALLGVLRFTGLLPLPQMHSFFSGLGATAAYPLLAATFIWSGSVVAQRWRFASIFFVIAGAFGLIASALEFALWGNLVALVSVTALLIHGIRVRNVQASMGAAALLVALILFASKAALPPYLQPGDFLHVFMALGLMLLSRKASLAGG